MPPFVGFRRRRSDAGPKRRRIRKLRFLALLAALGMLSFASFAYGLVRAVASEIPSLDPARQTHLEQDGYIYASDGKTVLTVLRGSESRIIVGPNAVAPVMKQAIVSVEDKRFWQHRGVDVRGILRAIWADARHKEVVEGGSTITQQFVKNVYTSDARTISRKLKEAALAWQLESGPHHWSKERILAAYLNTIYFGNGAYGIEMAARVYFRKHARHLTLPEAALLAGIPSNPAAYDPVTNPQTARARRLTVLRMMLAQGLITRPDLDGAAAAPMPNPDKVRLPGKLGPAPYFTEYVKQQLIRKYGSGKVFGGGLRVYTSIDLDLQRIAQESIAKVLTDPKGPSAALVAIDPRDGRVLAMVGGRNFKKSQFNLAVQGERQSGSAFKPFVLATALAHGISPATHIESKPVTIAMNGTWWNVHNYENSYLGSIDVTTATTYSDNSAYAQLTAIVGPKNVVRTAHALGITSPLHSYFGIGLGVEAVNPLEMARAFSTFANNGARMDSRLFGNEPRAVLAIEQRGRREINDPKPKQVLSEADDAMLTAILETVVEEGTGVNAALPDRPVAGKTGTTENYGDAWFVGYTPQLAVAVWVGYPNKLRPMRTEYDGEPVAGGTLPALIWKTFAQAALRKMGEPPESFPPAAAKYAVPRLVTYRDNRWELDNGYCRETREVLYVPGFEPEKTAPCKPNEVDVPDVVGLPLDDAQARLASTPLTPEVATRPARPGERLGRVTSQDPAGGTLSSFDKVIVVVPKATEGIVPKVVGLPILKARARLARHRFVPVVKSYADGEVGAVLAQFPKPHRAGARRLQVRLVVGRG